MVAKLCWEADKGGNGYWIPHPLHRREHCAAYGNGGREIKFETYLEYRRN